MALSNQMYQMLRATSRTFTLSIELLPDVVGDAIAVSYLLLRVSDYLEDNEEMEAGRKADLLTLWADLLQAGQAGDVSSLTTQLLELKNPDEEAYVAQQAHEILHQMRTLPEPVQEIIVHYVRETTMGMAKWQNDGPIIGTEDEMDDYMHYVAGVVGYLITEVFAWHSPVIKARKEELMPLSRQYGLALQTVNIIRGMRKDYERGWIFVPKTYYEGAGLSCAQMFEPAYRDRSLVVVNRLADKALTHLDHGIEYIKAFPRHQHRIRLACMWPLLFAAKTLAVSRGNVAVLDNEAKMTREEVKRIMRNTTMMGWSNRWVNRYYQQLSEPVML
ncbi:MAG TPA: squalene/phytoene synthase family protein [Anaerolineae bacterium]|nr:squalene/phytoene synthase family protein [Anaerolineae bacterium]